MAHPAARLHSRRRMIVLARGPGAAELAELSVLLRSVWTGN